MIVLLPYDTAWATAFADEAARLRGALPESFVDLQHVGSTAIPGLIAKPVIDILAVVSSVEALDRDYLRAHAAVAEEYGRLKLRLAGECSDDTRRYSSGKTDFIRDVERRAAGWNARAMPGRSRMTFVEPDEPTAGWLGRSLWFDSLAGHLGGRRWPVVTMRFQSRRGRGRQF